MNKCLSKFFVSVTRKDGSFHKKAGLLLVLEHHLKSAPNHNENFSSGKPIKDLIVKVDVIFYK